jgi:hypothetical protein
MHLVVTQFKICRQFDNFVGFAASQRFHRRFEGCNTVELVADVWGSGSWRGFDFLWVFYLPFI